MKESTSGVQCKDGIELVMHFWEPSGPPRAVVALVHGQGEHMGRYTHVARAMTEAGFAFAAYDLRGHGLSGGKRGHTPSYSSHMDDMEEFLEAVEGRYSGIPRFLYGHSLGGGLVLNFCLRNGPELRGVIVTSPWLELAFAPPKSQITLARIMNRLYPGLVQHSGLETAALSHDPQVIADYENDELVHDRITARQFFEVHNAGLWALDHAGEWVLPLLLMHGSADRITSHEASRTFAERAKGEVEYRTWVGLFHELHNEPEKARVVQTMVDWVGARLLDSEGR